MQTEKEEFLKACAEARKGNYLRFIMVPPGLSHLYESSEEAIRTPAAGLVDLGASLATAARPPLRPLVHTDDSSGDSDGGGAGEEVPRSRSASRSRSSGSASTGAKNIHGMMKC